MFNDLREILLERDMSTQLLDGLLLFLILAFVMIFMYAMFIDKR